MAARSQAHLMAAERSKQNPINHRNRSLHIFNDDDVNCSLKAFHLAASPPHRPPKVFNESLKTEKTTRLLMLIKNIFQGCHKKRTDVEK